MYDPVDARISQSQTSVTSYWGGGGVRTPRTLPLDPPLGNVCN